MDLSETVQKSRRNYERISEMVVCVTGSSFSGGPPELICPRRESLVRDVVLSPSACLELSKWQGRPKMDDSGAKRK